MIDTDVDCLIETLKQFIDFSYPSKISRSPWILKERDQIELLYAELTSLRSFLTDSEKTRYTVEKVKALVIRIKDVATEVDDMVDSFVSSFVAKNKEDYDPNPFLELGNIMQKIQGINSDISELADNKKPDVLRDKESPSRVNISLPKEDKIVGFDVEAREIVDRLVGDQKKLDVISIVGMGGLGKTTLAKRAYYDPYVEYHFYIRGWVSVSQTYEKRGLLFSICCSLSLTKEAQGLSTEKLRELLYKRLKGKRYLIVIDDIWDVEAWNDIRICFPNDNLGSRILVTSRLMNVALHIKPDSPPHLLRFLTVEESWELLQQKVFADDCGCPTSLHQIGKQIAERCRGLPLAILVISGLLAKTEKSVDWWTQVSDSISSYIVSDPEQYLNTLALSYNHLPQHLKSCFLYFGAFQEDFEIDVRKLMWLWVAEGFVKQGAENVAEEYLMDLIERSLVIVDRRRSDGGVKVCRVHDLLHDLCCKKAREEKFLHEIKIKPFAGVVSSPNTTVRRSFVLSYVLDYIFSKPSSPITRSFLFFLPGISYCLPTEKISFLYNAFKHLRVLELRSVVTPFLPSEIGQLVQLRYLSLHTIERVLPESISTLWNLQTLVIYGASSPIDFSFCRDSNTNMTNLMNMCIWPYVRLQYPAALHNIRTISMLHLPFGKQPVLEMTPNLRKLGCVVSMQPDGLILFPPLYFLVYLEKLKIHIDIDFSRELPKETWFTCFNMLPHNLRKVTFLNCYLAWKDLSDLGRLPNLEILKMLHGNYQGPRWDTNDGEFQKLKYLKIQSPELAEWNLYSDHFPRLERLFMNGCRRLKELPMCLSNIPTLELIELRWPRSSAADSARQILEEQQNLGNDVLKLIIYSHRQYDPRDSSMPILDLIFRYSDSSEEDAWSDEESSDVST